MLKMSALNSFKKKKCKYNTPLPLYRRFWVVFNCVCHELELVQMCTKFLDLHEKLFQCVSFFSHVHESNKVSARKFLLKKCDESCIFFAFSWFDKIEQFCLRNDILMMWRQWAWDMSLALQKMNSIFFLFLNCKRTTIRTFHCDLNIIMYNTYFSSPVVLKLAFVI